MADKEIKEGDEVSWQWSGSRPGGTVEDVKEQGEMKMETKKGNEVKKNADPENPAVKVKRSGHDVVKKASELEVDEEGDKHKEAQGEEKTAGKDDDAKENGEKEDEGDEKDEDAAAEKAGDKRKADEPAEPASKKQKTTTAKEPKENGDKQAPKKKGRPAKKDANGASAASSSAKSSAKQKAPKKAATESGEPRRSGRNKS